MRAIMKSISPKECERIVSGEQTVLVSKTRPKIDTPFKCYIFCTKDGLVIYGNGKQYVTDNCEFLKGSAVEDFENSSGFCKWNGKVIGEFECDRIYEIKNLGSSFMIGNDIALTNRIARESCLEYPDLRTYLKDKKGYAWHISDLKIYDKPKELSKFWTVKCTNKRNSCIGCEVKPNCIKTITRPPQSWCYVEEL